MWKALGAIQKSSSFSAKISSAGGGGGGGGLERLGDAFWLSKRKC